MYAIGTSIGSTLGLYLGGSLYSKTENKVNSKIKKVQGKVRVNFRQRLVAKGMGSLFQFICVYLIFLVYLMSYTYVFALEGQSKNPLYYRYIGNRQKIVVSLMNILMSIFASQKVGVQLHENIMIQYLHVQLIHYCDSYKYLKMVKLSPSRKRFGSTTLPPGERANIQLSGTSVINMYKYIRQTHFHRHGYRLTTNGGGGRNRR